jgi:hypothetical protein
MLKIDNSLLEEVGLGGLPAAEKNSLLKHIYETLEMRVGIRLADQMTNQQLDEFEQYFEAKDDAGAFKWLEANFPNYKEIVQEEFDKLKAEVTQSSPQILSASQAAASQPPTPATSAPPQAAPQPPGAYQQPPAVPTGPQPIQDPSQAMPPPSAPTQPTYPPQQPQPQPGAMPPAADPAQQPYQPQPPYPQQQPPAGPQQG